MLAPPRSARTRPDTGHTDITPVVSFASPAPTLTSAEDIRQSWQACPGHDAVDALAFLALDLLAERDAFRESLHAALAVAHGHRLDAERLRDRHRREAR